MLDMHIAFTCYGFMTFAKIAIFVDKNLFIEKNFYKEVGE